jgi:hypothetical protein
LICADEGIHLRHLGFQFIAVTLDETPGDDETLRATFGFKPRRFENRVNRFLARRINEAASVDDKRIRFLACVVIS